MRSGIKGFVVALVLLAVGAGGAAADSRFDVLFDHYEGIREALVENSTGGVSAHARAIAAEATTLIRSFDAAAAGVAAKDAAAIQELLPQVRERADTLAAADGLEATRVAFAALTQPLTRWQKLVDGPRPVVVYCPMEKKAWLQPDGPVENPYDPSMLRCGDVVQR
ncbi:MAG: hypothetical protein PVG53_14825 [Holophagae bacterium]